MIESIIIFLGYLSGGLDGINDILDCGNLAKPLILIQKPELIITQQILGEPNYDSYSQGLASMIEKDPSYEEGFLSRQEYVDGKYPKLNEIVDEKVLYYIQGELDGYENDITDNALLNYVHEKITEIRSK